MIFRYSFNKSKDSSTNLYRRLKQTATKYDNENDEEWQDLTVESTDVVTYLLECISANGNKETAEVEYVIVKLS